MKAKFISIADSLEARVKSGMYGWEGGLPSATTLAEEFSTTVNTIKSALSLLQGKGLVTEPKSGVVYVNLRPITMTQYVAPAHLRREQGYSALISGTAGYRTLPEHVARKAGISPEGTAFTRQIISGEVVGGVRVPLQLATRYYLVDLSGEQEAAMRQDATSEVMFELKDLLHSHDEVCLSPATEQEQKMLGLPEGQAVLRVFETISRPGAVGPLMVQEIVLTPQHNLIFDYTFLNTPIVEGDLA